MRSASPKLVPRLQPRNALTRGSRLAAVSLIVLGCGTGERMATVTGEVTHKGKPLAGAHISFWPAAGTGRAATGVTDDSGYFTLGTLTASDGAPPGEYRISIIARGPDRPSKPGETGSGMPGELMPGDPLVPLKYFAPDSSGLTFEVKPGRNHAELKIPD